jgi:hypothetical protein
LFLVPLARAGDLSVTLAGSTLTYSVSGLAPESKYTVKIENGSTGSSTLNDHTSTPQGTIPPTQGTTGDTLGPGTTVHVKVYDEDGELVASASVITPGAVVPPLVRWIWMLLFVLGTWL